MTIPASSIVRVNPGVLAAAGVAIDLNGLILTHDTAVPVGTVQPFSSADDVGAFFGLSSEEYEAALIYFAGPENATKTPGQLYFSQYPDADVAAYLRSPRLDLTLTELKALTGTLTITADGVAKTSSAITLTAATSFSSAATIIAAAFTSPGFTVAWDTQRGAFLFTSSTTGATSTMEFAAGTLAAGLSLTQATGAALSQGAVAGVPGPSMDALVLVNQNWAAFTTVFEPVTDDKVLFSAWVNGKDDRYAYVGWDTDPNAKVAGNQTTWGYAITQAHDDGSVPVFGDLTHAAFVLSFIASLDFDRLNGRQTLAFKGQSGLLPSVSNQTDADALIGNGYNFYGAYATAKQDFVFMYPGSTPGQWKWVDSYVNQIWMNAQLQLAMFTLLQSVGSVPYNAEGYALVEAACADPLNAAINFGAIRTGVALSASQIAQIRNAVGQDVSGVITATGYYLRIVPATAGQRADRSSPSMTLYYADGGSIQKLTLASIEIQ